VKGKTELTHRPKASNKKKYKNKENTECPFEHES
jgi:hypothetical protein